MLALFVAATSLKGSGDDSVANETGTSSPDATDKSAAEDARFQECFDDLYESVLDAVDNANLSSYGRKYGYQTDIYRDMSAIVGNVSRKQYASGSRAAADLAGESVVVACSKARSDPSYNTYVGEPVGSGSDPVYAPDGSCLDPNRCEGGGE